MHRASPDLIRWGSCIGETMMKCPYMTNSIQASRNTFSYDEDGKCITESSILQELHPFVECLEGDCAAWQDGRCQYNGT